MTIKANRQSNLLEYSEGWVSIIVNTVLFVLKFWAGLTIGSIAITADAWHTLSDSLTSVVVLIGIRVSSKPPDRTHPFGHGRAELMASMIIGVLLAVVAFNFLLESVSNLRDHSPVTYSRFAVVVFAVSILVKEGLTQYAFWVGKKRKAKSIIADGWHHRSDAIASAIILLGMLVGANLWWIDGTLGVMVAVLIFYAAYSILLSAIRPLMGERVERELIEKVNFISKKTYPKDISLHHFHVHRYGKHTELTLHIRLSGDMHIEDSHAIARRIEELIKEELGIDTTIHVETAGDTSRQVTLGSDIIIYLEFFPGHDQLKAPYKPRHLLQRISKNTGRSKTELVREAVDEYLAK